MIIGWEDFERDCAYGVNDLSCLYVFIEEEYFLLDRFLNNLDQYTHRPVGEVVVVT